MTAEPQRLQPADDCWVTSADEVGNAHLVPFSSYLDGARGSTACNMETR